MTGDATNIRLRREQAATEQLIRYNALNTAAIDRYNQISKLLALYDPEGTTR